MHFEMKAYCHYEANIRFILPGALEALASEAAQSVGLVAAELGLCSGLTVLLRAFSRVFCAVVEFIDRAFGPKRPRRGKYINLM